MEFKIIENPKYTNRIDFGLHLNPDNDPLKFFFSSMRKEGFPDLIQGAIRGEGYIGSPEGVFFFGDLDGEDFAEGNIFKEHEVKVYHDNFGETIITKQLFCEILFDYSTRLLKHCQEKEFNLGQQWEENMQDMLKQLEGML